MSDLNWLIEQVRKVLIETDDTIDRQNLFTRFSNECQQLGIAEQDFYVRILKPAYKGIDWEEVRQQQEVKAKTEQYSVKSQTEEVEKKSTDTPSDSIPKSTLTKEGIVNKLKDPSNEKHNFSFWKIFALGLWWSPIPMTIFFLFFNSNASTRVYITFGFGILFLATIIISVAVPTSLTEESLYKKNFNTLRNFFLGVLAIVTLAASIFCGEAIKSQGSVYAPIYRSLKQDNICNISNEELLPREYETVFFLDISGTMRTTVAIEPIHRKTLTEIKNLVWQNPNDIDYINKIEAIERSKYISYIDAAMLKLCSEIIRNLERIPTGLKQKCSFRITTFSNSVYKCTDSMTYTKENVKESLHKIILNPLYKNKNAKTNFIEVLRDINKRRRLGDIKSSHTAAKLNVIIISDFLHDNSNRKSDSTCIRKIIDSIKYSNTMLTLITTNQGRKANDSNNDTLLDVKSLIQQLMTEKRYQISTNSDDFIIYSYVKSKSDLIMLYDNRQITESNCKLINIDSASKVYSLYTIGSIDFGQDYYAIDESKYKQPLIDSLGTEIGLTNKIDISYEGGINEEKPNHKLLVIDKVTGNCVEYQIAYLKALNKAGALFLTAAIALVAFFSFLFFIAWYKFKKRGNIDFICQ